MLVGHGTRDEQGTRQFFELTELLAALVRPMSVAPALLEFQSPTIQEAWQQLVDSGASHVMVAPLLLFSAGHAKDDIPQIVASCQRQSPFVTWSQSRPLSRHPSMVALAVQRGREIMVQCNAPPEQRLLVFVGRGSHDPCAQADTRLFGELVGHRLDVEHTVTAFYAMASPNVATVLNAVADSGRYREIIVQPHLLFAGRLHQAILDQVAEAALRYPNLRFLTAGYLGPDQLVAQAIHDRQRECFAQRPMSEQVATVDVPAISSCSLRSD